MLEDIPTTGCKGSKTTLEQNMGMERTWQKGWMGKKNMEKELQGLVEGSKVKVHLDSVKATFKKSQIGKSQTMMAYMDSGF